MKKTYYSFVLLLITLVPLHAQQESTTPIDSMYKEIERAFELCQRNKYGEAIEISTKVLSHSIKVNDDNLRARAYNVLGNAHYFVKNDSLSFDYLFKSKDLFIKEKDTLRIIIAYNNIGVNYRAYGDLEKSSAFFKKSLELAQKSQSPVQSVYPLYNIGFNLVSHADDEDNDYKESLIYLSEAEDLAEQYYESEAIKGEIFSVLIYVYHKLGNTKQSIVYYNKTIAFTKKYNYLDVLAEAHSNIAYVNAEDKNFEKAYAALDEYIAVKDSVYSLEQYEKAKQVEADNFLRENDIKLKLKEKENAIQESVISETRGYNIILVLFISALLVLAFLLYNKNKELKRAKDRAENLSKTKSEFYSEISHELRTPLYAVIELSGLLLKENINATHKEYLESLKFSGNHLMSLINNVLELNKVESGKLKIQLSEFDLKHLISNIIDSLEYALRDSNNTINLNFDSSIPDVLVGDSLKLSQVLINLISNAIKFTNDGHIDVVINKVEEFDEKVTVYFKVSDNGLGISQEKQGQVFEDFYQEHSKNSKSYKGTGLGLSIVKRMLTAMNSDIAVISNENEGATFYFELDFGKSKKADLSTVIYEDHLQQIKDFNILIVDDNKVNQLVTRKVLDQLNIKAKAVASGAEAVEIIKIEHFDCILMDLHMPELDGYETAKQIRLFNQDIAIVALTAASTEEVESKINDYDMDGYIMKPFFTVDFVETINKAKQNRNEITT
ncbi:ATP-binding protein [Lacinutrix sp. Hel_I_90]|uniref:tetratricopeptide repeat-containing hybrid sensor histidine kinase/response regulator n=1 Tax=Lacinutrix sp. Hel_I_90 TaxID=1249999 RepID=UPI000695B4A1|nr:ATP-binding protein [Lacinutrix sp. Hel_I_90]